MEHSKQRFLYRAEVDPATEVIYGTITMQVDRKTCEIPYYLISDEVFGLDESYFSNQPEMEELLGMIEYFYTESERLLDTVAIFPNIPDEIVRLQSFGEILQQWQRYFFLSNVKDVGFLVSYNQGGRTQYMRTLEELGFEEVLSSEEEQKSFYFYNVTYITPVDFPNDDDGAVLQSLKDAGVDMSKPHEVEFILLCSNRRMARKVAKIIELEGYTVEVDEDRDQGEYVLACTRTIPLTHQEIIRRLRDLESLTAKYEVTIDGWGAMAE
ncbi:ribonuclease E inhibitor RraB [Shouchella sp. 1P09AA]|uniref:ribonuclease E inhibitor RraB n=1 Tax=unclassified Shouchella TaxID=2893065 RepID=UPI0039A0FF70